MRNLLTNRRRHFYTSALLVLLLLGAYVPAGFMPASGTPFLVELCPDASPIPMPAHHHHHDHLGSHSHVQHCPFGSAPGAGPQAQSPAAFVLPGQSAAPRAIAEAVQIRFRRQTVHQPRGPPTPA